MRGMGRAMYPMRHHPTLRRFLALLTLSAVSACVVDVAEPEEDDRFRLVTVDGQPLPAQVGATTTGERLIIYSGGIARSMANGQCNFWVQLDRGSALDFTNQYIGTLPGECILRKGESKEIMYTFPFRNSTASTPRAYRFE